MKKEIDFKHSYMPIENNFKETEGMMKAYYDKNKSTYRFFTKSGDEILFASNVSIKTEPDYYPYGSLLTASFVVEIVNELPSND